MVEPQDIPEFDQATGLPVPSEPVKGKKQCVPIENLRGKDLLRRLGISESQSERILAGGDDTAWLHTKVTARVGMSCVANSLEQMALTQVGAAKMALNESWDEKTRVAAAAVVAQMGIAIARSCETNLDHAKQLDDPDGDASRLLLPQNLSSFGFPPVEQARITATSGEVKDAEVMPETKSPLPVTQP